MAAAQVDPGGSGIRQIGGGGTAGDLQRQAWQWALTDCTEDGSLPSRRTIAYRCGRHERSGPLVKRAGTAGEFTTAASAIDA